MSIGNAVAAEPVELAAEPPSIDDLLAVLDEFDAFGGSSVELVAWELCSDTAELIPLWDALRERALLVDVGRDPVTCERLVRLSRRGRRAARVRAACACAREAARAR